jgi:hypothetical protein
MPLELAHLLQPETLFSQGAEALEESLGLPPGEMKEVVQEALSRYPDFDVPREVVIERNGKQHTLILTKDSKNRPDILVRTHFLGQGAAGQVHGASSLRTGELSAIKYTNDLADQAELEKEAFMLAQSSKESLEKGVQQVVRNVTLLAKDDKKKEVLIGPLYSFGDQELSVLAQSFGEELLGLSSQDEITAVFTNPELRNKKIRELISQLTLKLKDDSLATTEKRKLIFDFRMKEGFFLAQFLEAQDMKELTAICLDLEKGISHGSATNRHHRRSNGAA